MERRPFYTGNKFNYIATETEVDDCAETSQADPDLLLLRQAAIAERRSIAFYLTASVKTCEPLSGLFLETARDEMIHFRKLMILLARYDTEQAEAFAGAGINLPGEFRKSSPVKDCLEEKLGSIDLLSQAIVDELEAINMYQRSYDQAVHDDVKTLFYNNGNDEKVHLAEFWKALMTLTKENISMPR